jgi:protoporphyrinogen oxidase
MNTDADCLILGSGPSGLGAAHTLKKDGINYLILEADLHPGGLGKTDVINGYSFDYAPHFLHTQSKAFQAVVEETGVIFDSIVRKCAVLAVNQVIPYPLQFNLWALPEELRNSAWKDISGQSLSSSSQTLDPQDFQEALLQQWGETLYQFFFRPYNEKMWQRPLHTLPVNTGGRFIPKLDLDAVRIGMQKQNNSYGYNATFCYPRSGRIGELFDCLAKQHKEVLLLNTAATNIDVTTKTCHIVNGSWRFKTLISTVPLDRLVKMVNCPLPLDGIELIATDIINLHVGFSGRVLQDIHWVYTPEEVVPFYRVSFPSNINSVTCPPGCASLSIELASRANEPEQNLVDLTREAVDYLQQYNLIEIEKIEYIKAKYISPAYVIPKFYNGKHTLDEIFACLGEHGIYCAGRYGTYSYFSMEDAWLNGKSIAEKIGSLN